MMKKMLIGFVLFILASQSFADEIRPGYLALTENSPNVFSVLWKVPANGNKKLNLQAQLPGNCTNKTQANAQLINGAYIQRWIVVCKDGLIEQPISVVGLDLINTDVLLHLEFSNGTSQSVQLTPTKRSYHVQAEASSLQIIGTYTWLGIGHILWGVDHLLFVFALLIIVNSKRRLLWTITAFTVAHSITLASATLGFVHVPQQPVEAIIALSILFLAVEIIHGQQGRPGYAERWPWLVAFIFGLLHGFGFAGALTEIGLPQQAIPLALIFFNIGVEIGQLLFVLVVVLLTWLLHQLNQQKLLSRAETAVIYSIGGLSSFWLFERISLF
ncbi:MAG: HupE/UreJ family protein [Gammaproteobacteria bacterium]|nr:MAG: HupE/UreJ family protein [Gammaproteobacteria bacterium]